MALKLAFYADDFTGATDTLATLAQGGQRAMLFLRPPAAAQLKQAGPLDAIGIAGAARSMQNAAQTAELTAVAAYLATTNAPVVHYKTCSTFDSSPHVGSIGLAVRILHERLKAGPFVPVLGGQPNLGRYCVFGNVFAAFQTGGPAFRLDRHPTMRCHPVTPMCEADLRLHLHAQGLNRISSIQYPCYGLTDDALDAKVDEAVQKGADGVLFDVASDADLARIGRQVWNRARQSRVLAVGPSSVEQALLAYWRSEPRPTTGLDHCVADVSQHDGGQAKDTGPVLVLSGSMSPLTAQQISTSSCYRLVPLPVAAILDEASEGWAVASHAVVEGLKQGHNVLAHLVEAEPLSSTGQAGEGAALAQASGTFLAHVLNHCRPRRLGLAGGDTSSHAVRSLDVWGLAYIGQIDPGVALCRLHASEPFLDGLEVMLKGGQMGSLHVFDKLAGATPRHGG